MNMPPDAEQLFMAGLQSKIPHLKTQAQLTAYMAGFDAFCQWLDAIFAEDPSRALLAHTTMLKAAEVAKQSTEISRKLADVPEAATGPGADIFKNPPKEFGEYDLANLREPCSHIGRG